MILIDLLGRKWTLRILWELVPESCTFRKLQSRCGEISPTMINKRLKELVGANLVEKIKPNGYQLTRSGKELIDLFDPLNEWIKKWEKTLPST